MEKNEKKTWFVNISEYPHGTMGLLWKKLKTPKRHFKINWPLADATQSVHVLDGNEDFRNESSPVPPS